MTCDARYWANIRAELDALPAQTLTPVEYMAYVAALGHPASWRPFHTPNGQGPPVID
jgi:hypothetical protein